MPRDTVLDSLDQPVQDILHQLVQGYWISP